MSGTAMGGKKAFVTNIARHGEDFYKLIGKIGGKNGHTGGFAYNPELARIVGAKGGRVSRRKPSAETIARRLRRVARARPESYA